MGWPLGAKQCHTRSHGVTLTSKQRNHFKRAFGFKSPSSHSLSSLQSNVRWLRQLVHASESIS